MDPPRRRSRRVAEQDPDRPPKRQKTSQTARASSHVTASIDDLGAGPPHTSARDILASYAPSRGPQDEKLVACLNAFLDFLPPDGATAVANDIVRCGDDDDELFQVFENLRTALLVPMKSASRGPSVVSSPHSKRKEAVESVAQNLPSPLVRERRFREDCLRRDNYHCVVSKVMDLGHWEEIGSPQEQRRAAVEAAHIIPFSYANFRDKEAPPKDIIERWAVLYRCFPFLEGTVKANNINDLSNALSLHATLHREFGNFTMSFQPMEKGNTYRVKTYPRFDTEFHSLPKDGILELDPNTDDSLQLPDPNLLAVHFAIAEVLHASGMGNEIDKVIRDMESIGCLREDGATDIGRILNTALWVGATA
ncbi:hypothetical protein FQN50_008405 [Emmonsiellopsis sp. PD_5]|nr:hypothetical protein FQN50_008405 [Emmonsiellopsis sp. PD_5]